MCMTFSSLWLPFQMIIYFLFTVLIIVLFRKTFWQIYTLPIFFEFITSFLLKYYFPIHRILFRPKYLYISFDTNKIEFVHQLPNKQEGKIRIVSISDTHERESYYQNNLPDGEIFIHCGDILFQNRSVSHYAQKYLENYNDIFLGKLKHELKIQVAGNHDGILELLPKSEIDSMFSNATYLHDECMTFHTQGRKLKIYGTPTSGKGISKNGAFQKPFGSSEIMKEWEKIPGKPIHFHSSKDIVSAIVIHIT